jgi:putative solute:sodium symporter small subunit
LLDAHRLVIPVMPPVGFGTGRGPAGAERPFLRLFRTNGGINSGERPRFAKRRHGERRVTENRETPRWEASWALTVGVIVAAILIALGPVMFATMIGQSTMLGLPTSYFLAGIVVPPLIAVTIFWFAENQDRIDRRFDGLET